MLSLEEILDRLEGIKSSGSGWIARCPSHEDNSASLSIHEGEDGKVLWHCHAGCSQETLCEAFSSPLSPSGGKSDHHPIPEAIYDYTAEDGSLLYQVVRMPGKKFQQRQPDGQGGWIWNMQGARKVLYRLPEVIQAVSQGEVVVITEGEKDADAVKAAGWTATCPLGGAGKWKKEYTRVLQGAKVYIVTDRDDPGRNHAEAIRKSLVGVAAEVYAVEAKEGKDAYDHLVVHNFPLTEMTVADLRDVSDEMALSAVELKSVEWHWKPFVQVSAFHLLAGEGGIGKGSWLALMTAAITTGQTEHLSTPRNVIVVASEDSAGYDLLPRVLAAGGDPSRVVLLRKPILLPRDIEYLEEKIDQQRNGYGTGAVIIDPVANHIGGVSSDEESAVRHAINELNHVADRTGCAIIGVRHTTKSGTGDVKSVLGSGAWVNSPRVVLVITQDEDRAWDADARVLRVVKSNRGSRGNTLHYRLGGAQVSGVTGDVPILTRASFAPAPIQEAEPDEWFSHPYVA